jgi:hypothetical protein
MVIASDSPTRGSNPRSALYAQFARGDVSKLEMTEPTIPTHRIADGRNYRDESIYTVVLQSDSGGIGN